MMETQEIRGKFTLFIQKTAPELQNKLTDYLKSFLVVKNLSLYHSAVDRDPAVESEKSNYKFRHTSTPFLLIKKRARQVSKPSIPIKNQQVALNHFDFMFEERLPKP